MSLRQLIFPAQKRSLPGKRLLSVVLRSLHLVGIAGLAGLYLYQRPFEEWQLYLWLALGSGILMMALELYANGIWLLQLRGQAILLKLLLLGAGGLWWASDQALLYLGAILLSGFFAHAPGKIRYYSLLHRRVLTEPLPAGTSKDSGEL